MIRVNPLIAESLRGLIGVGQAHLAYLNCLLLQGVVLLFWWPKRTLSEALLTENPPDSLLAVVLALGITTAYYALRTGAEEVLLNPQQPLRGWVVATPVSLPRILTGFVCARMLQTLQALLLSSPLLLAAYSVGGGRWPVVGWCVVTVVAQAVFYHLVGAVLYTLVGQYKLTMFLSLRIALVVVYATTIVLLPEASQVVVTYELLSAQPWLTSGALAPHIAFLALYTGASVVLAVVLMGLLAHYRRRFSRASK